MRRIWIAIGLTVIACGAQGQTFGTFQPSIDFFMVQRVDRPGDPTSPSSGAAVAASDVLAAAAAQQGASSAALVSIANRIDRLNQRFSEGIALAGSVNVLPPNPGDRFAVSFGGAGYGGSGAGSIAVSTRIGENALAYIGVAQGPTQTLVKGGVGFSFR